MTNQTVPLPPYHEAVSASGVDSWEHPTDATLPPPAFHFFPTCFILYYRETSGAKWVIGRSRNEDMFAVSLSFTSGAGAGAPSVVIYDGSTTDSPVIARSTNASALGENHSRFLISTMSRPQNDGEKLVETLEMVKHKWYQSLSYRFFTETDAGGGLREDFEWRHGPLKNKQLNETDFGASGWRLVRKSDDAKNETILAVCYVDEVARRKLVRFTFYGEGRTGELGFKWQLMAVITGLTLWKRDVDIDHDDETYQGLLPEPVFNIMGPSGTTG